MSGVQHAQRRLIGALIASMLCALGAIAVAAPRAEAGVHNYCGWGVSPYSRCSSTPGADIWDQNTAIYPGANGDSTSVCQVVYRADNGAQATRTCAFMTASSGWDLYPYAGGKIATIPWVGNNSAYNHTINGQADKNFGQPDAAGLITAANVPLSPDAPAVSTATLPLSLTGAIAALKRPADGSGEVKTLATAGESVSLKPTANGVCLSTSTHGPLTCNSMTGTSAGELEGVIICSPHVAPDHVIVYGVVPDGAVAVEAVEGSRVVASTPVTGNTYRLELAKVTATTVSGFSWTANTGVVHAMGNVLPHGDLSCS